MLAKPIKCLSSFSACSIAVIISRRISYAICLACRCGRTEQEAGLRPSSFPPPDDDRPPDGMMPALAIISQDMFRNQLTCTSEDALLEFPCKNEWKKYTRSKNMTCRKTSAAIALLLMAMLAFSSCSSGGGSTDPGNVATAAVKAMRQAVDVQTPSGPQAGRTYKMDRFTADDGTEVVSGAFTVGSNGEITDATLTMRISGQLLDFTLKDSVATVGDTTIPESAMPEMMTESEETAFRFFLMGFDELQDEIRERIEESLDDIDDRHREPGTVAIPDNPFIEGTITLGYEEGDDRDDIDVIGGNVRLKGRIAGMTATGTFSFTSMDDYEDADLDLKISAFEEDGISLAEFSIRGTIKEYETRGEDRFEFEGYAGGRIITPHDEFSVHFDGTINAADDDWVRFPEYSLTIDGRSVAIGRPERPFR